MFRVHSPVIGGSITAVPDQFCWGVVTIETTQLIYVLGPCVMQQILKLVFLFGFTIFAWSCSTAQPVKAEKPSEPITQCSNPRPEICTREYRPICATRDTGIRCVTTPCLSTEEVTYATGCTACADPKVSHYRPGKC